MGLKWGHLKHMHLNKEMSMWHLWESSHTSSVKSPCQHTFIMCQYINAYSTGNKEEALEVQVQLLSYSIIGITETSWDCSHNWNVAADEYRPFMQDRQGRRGGCVLYVGVYWECMELYLGKDDEPNNSWWVRILGQTNVGNIVLVVCCRLPDQAEGIYEAFFRQMEEAPYSQALVLLGELLPSHSCWKDNTVGHKYSRKFLERVSDNSVTIT